MYFWISPPFNTRQRLNVFSVVATSWANDDSQLWVHLVSGDKIIINGRQEGAWFQLIIEVLTFDAGTDHRDTTRLYEELCAFRQEGKTPEEARLYYFP